MSLALERVHLLTITSSHLCQEESAVPSLLLLMLKMPVGIS